MMLLCRDADCVWPVMSSRNDPTPGESPCMGGWEKVTSCNKASPFSWLFCAPHPSISDTSMCDKSIMCLCGNCDDICLRWCLKSKNTKENEFQAIKEEEEEKCFTYGSSFENSQRVEDWKIWQLLSSAEASFWTSEMNQRSYRLNPLTAAIVPAQNLPQLERDYYNCDCLINQTKNSNSKAKHRNKIP